jgi:hypothetical protein
VELRILTGYANLHWTLIMGERFNLRPGAWMVLRELPSDVTATEVAAFVCDSGLCIADTDVAFLPGHAKYGTSCVIAVPNEEVRALIGWALTQKPFRGERLKSVLPFTSKRTPRF